MKIKINNTQIMKDHDVAVLDFPKYTTQIMNLANQNSQGTRPKVVGQMSDLIIEFTGNHLEEWRDWYLEKNPTAIADATEKVYSMVEQLKQAIVKIDKQLCQKWIEDLVINKTFLGLKVQLSILKALAENFNTTYKLSTPIEESKGIDGYLDDLPVSIKPSTYKMMNKLPENIKVPIIFYEKTKTGLIIDAEMVSKHF